MLNVIERPPPSTAETRRGGHLLTLRLSDGHTWAHAFGASSPHDLREGSFEAFVECSLEWPRRADQLPSYQTIKRASLLARVPRTLELHVREGSFPHSWLNANYGTNAEKHIVVHTPGSATNGEAWEAAPWEAYWLRCLRCWLAADALARFCRTVVRDLDLDDRIAAEMERIRHLGHGGEGAVE